MIGIITFHTQYNCGSALQVFALQEKIRDLGYECEVLDYYYAEDMRNYDIRWYTKNLKVILFDLYTFRNSYARKKSYKIFQKKYLKLSARTKDWHELKEISKDCNVLVCGSDQIWNVGLTYGPHPAYFLKFASHDQKLVSYAPSVALSMIPEGYKKEIKSALKKFSCVSVREQQTADELEEITGEEVACVLDPTLLHNAEFYNQLICDYKLALPDKYIFIYCLHYTNLDKLKKTAEYYAKENNLPIIYFNKFNIHNNLYKQNIFKYGPEAFLCAIKNAEFVVADSYHAAVFSIQYRKEFLAYALKDSRSRLDTLFRKLGIENHFIEDNFRIPHKINYDVVYEKLIQERENSIEFLKEALGDNKDERK